MDEKIEWTKEVIKTKLQEAENMLNEARKSETKDAIDWCEGYRDGLRYAYEISKTL